MKEQVYSARYMLEVVAPCTRVSNLPLIAERQILQLPTSESNSQVIVGYPFSKNQLERIHQISILFREMHRTVESCGTNTNIFVLLNQQLEEVGASLPMVGENDEVNHTLYIDPTDFPYELRITYQYYEMAYSSCVSILNNASHHNACDRDKNVIASIRWILAWIEEKQQNHRSNSVRCGTSGNQRL